MEAYTLLLRQGAGSYATVWRARRRADGRIVAIKQLRERGLSWEDVLRSAEVAHWKDLRHPNVLQLEAVVRLRGISFIVMPFCQCNVYQYMQQMMGAGRSLSEGEVRWVMRAVLSALAYCHSVGIMHRDIKPENVLLSADGGEGGVPVALLCDFGQAKPIAAAKLTDYVATRWYRAPELLLHAARYGPAVDVYAAGVMMAELFTMRPIFPGSSEADQLFRIASVMGAFTRADWPDGPALAAAMGHALPAVPRTGVASILPRTVSPAAVAAIEAMLTWNPARRPTAEAVLGHPFFRDGPLTPVRPASSVGLKPGDEPMARAEAETAQAEIEAMLREVAAEAAAAAAGGSGSTAAAAPATSARSASSDGSSSGTAPAAGTRIAKPGPVAAMAVTAGGRASPSLDSSGSSRTAAGGASATASAITITAAAAAAPEPAPARSSSGAASAIKPPTGATAARSRAVAVNPFAALGIATPAGGEEGRAAPSPAPSPRSLRSAAVADGAPSAIVPSHRGDAGLGSASRLRVSPAAPATAIAAMPRSGASSVIGSDDESGGGGGGYVPSFSAGGGGDGPTSGRRARLSASAPGDGGDGLAAALTRRPTPAGYSGASRSTAGSGGGAAMGAGDALSALLADGSGRRRTPAAAGGGL